VEERNVQADDRLIVFPTTTFVTLLPFQTLEPEQQQQQTSTAEQNSRA